MITSYPLWSNNGYALNTQQTMERLVSCSGMEVGLCSVIPFAASTDHRRAEWRRRIGERLSGPVHEVLAMPDRGVTPLRRLSDAVVSSQVARMAGSGGGVIVHARGIRAAAHCARIPESVPVVVDIRGDIEAEARLALSRDAAKSSPARVRWAIRETDLAARRGNAFLCVSEAMREWWIGRGGAARGRRIEVVPCPVEVEEFKSHTTARDESLVIAYLGGLQHYQPPELIVDTLARLGALVERPRFWVITPDDTPSLRKMLADEGVDAVVETLSHDSVKQRLAEADVGIVPRKPDNTNYVACPTKIGEYLAAGVPVLASGALASWSRILHSEGVGLSLDEGDETLRRFLADVRSRREDYRQRCIGLAHREWSWPNAMSTITSIYRSLGGFDADESGSAGRQ